MRMDGRSQTGPAASHPGQGSSRLMAIPATLRGRYRSGLMKRCRPVSRMLDRLEPVVQSLPREVCSSLAQRTTDVSARSNRKQDVAVIAAAGGARGANNESLVVFALP